MNKIIYLDNSASTPVRKEVIWAMSPYWNRIYANPNSITKQGIIARQAVEKARGIVAKYLSARPSEIIFTGSGTEANNLAIFGMVLALEKQGRKISSQHFISTNIEHSSITECFHELERRGAKVDFLPVNEKGIIGLKDLRKAIRSNTVLVSVGYANNEIGTVQPIKEIAKEIRHTRNNHSPNEANDWKGYPLFHTDASQAGLYLNLRTNELGVDFMTLDAQKINGPKGIGALYVRAGVNISPIIFGGGQERGLRSGTENVPLIVGLAKAFDLARENNQGFQNSTLEKIRDYFWHKIKKEIPEVVLNGDLENRLSNNLNISIPGIDSEFTVLCLDEKGIVCSTKSACNRDEGGSFVVRALYKNLNEKKADDLAKSSLRFSLPNGIAKSEIDYVVRELKLAIDRQKNNQA